MYTLTVIPEAYMGPAPAFLPEKVARICMRCPDKAAAEAYAKAQGESVTHGECPNCHAAFMAELSSYQLNKHVS